MYLVGWLAHSILDSVHLMSPYAGAGANLAMIDSAELALALAKPDWDVAIRAFEEKMQECAEGEASQSAKNMVLFMSKNGAQAAADMFRELFAMIAAGGGPGSHDDGSGHGRGHGCGRGCGRGVLSGTVMDAGHVSSFHN